MKRTKILAVAFALMIASMQTVNAQDPTFEDVLAIHKVLQADGCDYVYLAMGERQLFVTDSGFEAEAECEGKQVFLFSFDKEFNLLEKTAKDG